MVGIQGASIVVSALAVVSGAVRAGGPGYCLVTTVQGRKRAPRGSVRGPSVEPAGVGVQACMNRTTRNSRPLSSDSRRVLHPSHHQHTGREHAHTCTTRICTYMTKAGCCVATQEISTQLSCWSFHVTTTSETNKLRQQLLLCSVLSHHLAFTAMFGCSNSQRPKTRWVLPYVPRTDFFPSFIPGSPPDVETSNHQTNLLFSFCTVVDRRATRTTRQNRQESR